MNRDIAESNNMLYLRKLGNKLNCSLSSDSRDFRYWISIEDREQKFNLEDVLIVKAENYTKLLTDDDIATAIMESVEKYQDRTESWHQAKKEGLQAFQARFEAYQSANNLISKAGKPEIKKPALLLAS